MCLCVSVPVCVSVCFLRVCVLNESMLLWRRCVCACLCGGILSVCVCVSLCAESVCLCVCVALSVCVCVCVPVCVTVGVCFLWFLSVCVSVCVCVCVCVLGACMLCACVLSALCVCVWCLRLTMRLRICLYQQRLGQLVAGKGEPLPEQNLCHPRRGDRHCCVNTKTAVLLSLSLLLSYLF